MVLKIVREMLDLKVEKHPIPIPFRVACINKTIITSKFNLHMKERSILYFLFKIMIILNFTKMTLKTY